MRRFPWRAQRASAARQSAGGSLPAPGSPASDAGRDLGPRSWTFSRRSVQVIAVVTAVAVLGLVFYAGDVASALGSSSSSQALSQRETSVQPPSPADQGGTQAALTGSGGPGSGQPAAKASAFRHIILPDLLIVTPNGLIPQQTASLRKIPGMRHVITFDGARISVGGQPVNVIGVNPATFRSWVPLQTASDQAFWTALSKGEFVAAAAAATAHGLVPGDDYQFVGASSQTVQFAMAAKLGLAGVDLIVNQATSARLGLVRQTAGLISAPGVSLTTLQAEVSAVLGPSGQIVVLRSQLPVATVPTGTVPTNYIQLFKASAAQYCPGLSWTVLAAIGQIESADGQNMGPSSAGALGPMQFMPATWAAWGIDGFGQTGPPSVMNPFDAVPSAARLLCADGAAAGGKSLYNAIFDYNHADWYVREVLSLAAQYAANYP
jgi:transglycosylase-like protein with SLT domain